MDWLIDITGVESEQKKHQTHMEQETKSGIWPRSIALPMLMLGSHPIANVSNPFVYMSISGVGRHLKYKLNL